jgi:pimeloyl-ACP methyl ester carboxylesterase
MRVHFPATDGLRCDGWLRTGRRDRRLVVIHVHGKCGNAYQNDFLPAIAGVLNEAGVHFLTFNNRGHDILAEGYRHGELTYVGGAVERFAECVLDLEGAVSYTQALGWQPILQGHSNGCEKVLYACSSLGLVAPLVLISPADSKELHRRWLAPETIEHQLARIASEYSRSDDRFLPYSEYGIRCGQLEYSIPVTSGALLDLLRGPALDVIDYAASEPLVVAASPALLCIGTSDPYQTLPVEETQSRLQRVVPKAQFLLVPGADHHFHGLEHVLADGVASWVARLADYEFAAKGRAGV